MFQKPTAATHYVCRRLRKTNIHTFHTTLTFPFIFTRRFSRLFRFKASRVRKHNPSVASHLLRKLYTYSITIYTFCHEHTYTLWLYIYIYTYIEVSLKCMRFLESQQIHYLIQYVLPVYLHFSFVHILYIIDRSIYAHTLPAEYFDPNRRYIFWDEPPGISYLSLAPLSHFFHTMQVCTYIARTFLLRKSDFFFFWRGSV